MTDQRLAAADTIAREYLRVSHDRSGRAASVEEQHNQNRCAAEREAWVLGDPYGEEKAISASRHTTKARGGFAELMADLESGRFGASVLILWESSRGSRRVGEWLELIDVAAERGVTFYVTTHGRRYDPRNGRDRRSLLEDAVDSEYESTKLSERMKRSHAARAAAGAPSSRAAYGYVRRYDETTRKLAAQEPHPDEAPVVAEMFSRVIAGHSLRSITADLAARGVEKRSGGPFSAQHLRSMLLNPVYAGIRVHDPDRGGRRGRQHVRSPGARTTPGQWDGIVSEADFYAVQRILSDPSRRTNRPGRGVHLLSMIATCGECGGPLAAAYRGSGRSSGPGKKRRYQCHRNGCVRVDADDLDDVATEYMLGYLARPDAFEDFTAGQGDTTAEIEHARAEVAGIRAELDDLVDQLSRGELSATLAARAEPGIQARLRAAEKRERELSAPSALRGLIEPGADVAQRWEAAPMSTRREVARMLLVPGSLGALAVTRRPEGRRGGRHVMPVWERVEWRRGETTAS